MKRRSIISVMLLVFVAFVVSGQVMAKNETMKVLERSGNRVLLKQGNQYHDLQLNERSDGTRTVTDIISYYEPPTAPEAYDDFLAGYQGQGTTPDTCINWFTLLAPGSVNKIFMQNESAGTATMYLWSPSTYYDPVEDGWYYSFPDDADLVNMLMPFGVPLTCAAQVPEDQFTGGSWTPTWNELDLVTTFGAGIYVDGINDSLDIWAGYAMDGTGGPTMWQDGTFHDPDIDGSCKSFSTLHSEGTGWYRIISSSDDRLWVAHMMQIEVEYDAVPPFIEDVSHFSNTFDGNKTVSARIYDLESDPFDATMRYKIGVDGTPTDVTMTNVEGDLYEAPLTGLPGDTVYYGITAEDTSGLSHSVGYYNFVVYDPPSGIPVLLVNDGGFDNDSLFALALDNLGQDYYRWNMDEEGGIDASVINYTDFAVVFVFGWGTSIVPVTNQEDIYGIGDYLDSGRGLVLVDMDWFFTNDLPETGTFGPGDFAYDYFGLGNYHNDPVGTGGASAADVEMYGVTGDPISDEFVSSAFGPVDYEAPDPAWANWGDYVYPNSTGTAHTVFTGKTNGESMAVFNDNDYQTLYFGFHPELITASQFAEFELLIDNILGQIGICVKGDVNNDELINVSDIVKIVRYILELETPTEWGACAADLNGDGNINVTDIVNVVNIILGSGRAASFVDLGMEGGDLYLKSDGEIGAMMLNVASGDVEMTPADGVELHWKTTGDLTTIILYSLDGSLPSGKPVIRFSHPVIIEGDPIAADRQANEVPVRITAANEYSLHQNYPNPFNPNTSIVYSIPEAGMVSLSVYNILGQNIVDIVSEFQVAGQHQALWNGRDANGNEVSSGIYFYQLKAGDYSSMKKMFFIK